MMQLMINPRGNTIPSRRLCRRSLLSLFASLAVLLANAAMLGPAHAEVIAQDVAASIGLDFPSRNTQGESPVIGNSIILSGHQKFSWPILTLSADGYTEGGALEDRGDRHGCVNFPFNGGTALLCTHGADEGACVILNGICRKWPKELYLNLGPSGGVRFATATANARARGLEMPYDRGREVIAFDMDNDGDMDLAAANEAPSEVLGPGGAVNRLFRNTGSAFKEVTNTPIRREVSSTSVVAGDVDGNGFQDLLFAGQGGVRIYKNSGGTFGSPTTIVPGARQIELAQIDGDTLPDLVVVEQKRVTVRLNNGSGAFPAANFSFPLQQGRDVAVADVNGDGQADIYVVQGKDGSANAPDVMLVNNGGGTSFRSVPIPQASGGDGDLATAILNGSGPGRAAILVTNGRLKNPGPVEYLVFSGS